MSDASSVLLILIRCYGGWFDAAANYDYEVVSCHSMTRKEVICGYKFRLAGGIIVMGRSDDGRTTKRHLSG